MWNKYFQSSSSFHFTDQGGLYSLTQLWAFTTFIFCLKHWGGCQLLLFVCKETNVSLKYKWSVDWWSSSYKWCSELITDYKCLINGNRHPITLCSLETAEAFLLCAHERNTWQHIHAIFKGDLLRFSLVFFLVDMAQMANNEICVIPKWVTQASDL